jgi:hypothetical protein
MNENINGKNFPKLIYALLLAIMSTSCVTGMTANYKALSNEEREQLRTFPQNGEVLADGQYIYKVTPQQLQLYLSSKERTIVYEYKSTCTSENCISAEQAECICRDKGYGLCILSAYYPEAIDARKHVSPSVFVAVIDNRSYALKFPDIYEPKFIQELVGWEKTETYGRFFRFAEGAFEGCYDSCLKAVED